jgi:hypothetical protein
MCGWVHLHRPTQAIAQKNLDIRRRTSSHAIAALQGLVPKLCMALVECYDHYAIQEAAARSDFAKQMNVLAQHIHLHGNMAPLGSHDIDTRICELDHISRNAERSLQHMMDAQKRIWVTAVSLQNGNVRAIFESNFQTVMPKLTVVAQARMNEMIKEYVDNRRARVTASAL